MWRTSSGDRTLVGAEAALLREAIASMTDDLLYEAEGLAEAWPYGVQAFDDLPWQQRLALLTVVARALLRPDVPPPELTAVNEATIAALFALIDRRLIVEIDEASCLKSAVDDCLLLWRRLVGACQKRPSIDTEFFVPVDSDDTDAWGVLVESIRDDILWDADFDMQDLFLDVQPSRGRHLKRRMGIEPDYFAAVAPDVRDQQIPALFSELRELSGSGPRSGK